jgi:hypothetical protein
VRVPLAMPYGTAPPGSEQCPSVAAAITLIDLRPASRGVAWPIRSVTPHPSARGFPRFPWLPPAPRPNPLPTTLGSTPSLHRWKSSGSGPETSVMLAAARRATNLQLRVNRAGRGWGS